ncbi:MAG: hypothetical protein ABJG47_08620 [Ekhidna sp.]
MKSIKQIIFLLILLSSSIDINAQKVSELYPDELVLKTDFQIDVKFRFYQMSKKEVYLKDDLWRSILNVMNTAVESSASDEGAKVTYIKKSGGENPGAKVEVKSIENNSDVFFIGSEGVTEVRSERIEFHIILHKVTISFSLNDLNDLEMIKDLSVESVWDQINLKYKDYGKRNVYKGEGFFKYGKANVSNISGESGGTDSIEISAGVGLGFYRDRFVPDLGFKLGFNLPDRYGNIKVQTGLIYTQQYLFTGSSEISTSEPDLNGFLTGFFNLKYGNGNEVGVGLGYLIHSEGDFYSGRTFKLSLFSQRSESKFNFTPELVYTNDFKQAFPALRFGLSF